MSDENSSDNAHPAGLRDRGEFSRSGDRFTEKAYRSLGHGAISAGKKSQLGAGLYFLLQAAITYRLGDQQQRCHNRCQQGVLIAEDSIEEILRNPAEQGILWEYVGDFSVIGQLPEYEGAYKRAATLYEDNGMAIADGWPADPLVHLFIELFLQLLEISGRDRDSGPWMYGFVDRANYKAEAYPDIVEAVTNADEWDP